MSAWGAVVALGAASLALRLGPLWAARRAGPHPGLERALAHAVPAVLAALAVRATGRAGTTGPPGSLPAIAVAMAVAVALASRRLPVAAVVAGGFGAYWLVVAGVAISGG